MSDFCNQKPLVSLAVFVRQTDSSLSGAYIMSSEKYVLFVLISSLTFFPFSSRGRLLRVCVAHPSDMG